MIFEPERVKGFKDIFPPESEKREQIRAIIQNYFNLYGFQPLETPVIEYDELMRSDALGEEDEAVSDRFRLKDKGNRNLGLRYEFTFQLARIFKQNPNIKLPFKRYQIGNVFRDEPTGPNRYRQFTQCDIDIVGSQDIENDAECLAVTADICKALKITPIIEVNNRKLISAIIESVRIQNKTDVMRELDKLTKLGEDTVKANLRKYADANTILTLFKLLEKDLDFFVKNLFDGAEEVKRLISVAKNYGVKPRFNPTMIRGLSYYTGNIFEVKTAQSKETIAAGGRYDNVIGKYIRNAMPAVGISFGLERLTNLATIPADTTKALLISLNQNKETLKLAQKLRKEDISCITTFGQPGKQLDYANARAIPYVIFVGDDEVAKKKYKLKTMASGEEKLLTEKQLVNKLKK